MHAAQWTCSVNCACTRRAHTPRAHTTHLRALAANAMRVRFFLRQRDDTLYHTSADPTPQHLPNSVPHGVATTPPQYKNALKLLSSHPSQRRAFAPSTHSSPLGDTPVKQLPLAPCTSFAYVPLWQKTSWLNDARNSAEAFQKSSALLKTMP